MQTVDKYRFSLQWGSDTFEKRQTGSFLEGLGNKKSDFIIAATTEYFAAHPEILDPSRKLQIVVNQNYTREQVKAIVLAVLDERLADVNTVTLHSSNPDSEPQITDADIDEMLQNLEIFT